MALEAEFHRGGVELFAVMKHHAGAELDRQRLVVGRPLVGSRELRDDGQLFVDIEQLVAQRGENDAADEASRQGRIEHIGIFGETDTQRLRMRCYRKKNQRHADGEPHQNSHECFPRKTHADVAAAPCKISIP